MNKLINQLTISLLLTLKTTACLFAQADTKEQLVVPLTNAGKAGFLEVSSINGYIHVTGYTGKDIVIDAVARTNQTNRTDDQPAANGMKRINTSNALDVTAEEKNNSVKVNTNSHRQTVDLTIKVPQRFSLKLIAINNGNITVDNVTGEIEVSNVNGAITLTNIGGSALAQTVNGDLKTTFREVNANSPMAFSTLNGNVDMTFPASVNMNVKLKSDMGEIFSDFDIVLTKGQPRTTRNSQSGMHRVTVEDWAYGKINAGGAEVMMKNMHGNIYMRKAK